MPTDNPTPEETAYWESVLQDHHLNMGRGKRKWLVYGHEYLDGDEKNASPEESE